MKKIFFLVFFILSAAISNAQDVYNALNDAYKNFESDPQLNHATASLYVIDANTGAVVFDKNAGTGMATASTLKVVTAATAYALLGDGFRYQTVFGYTGTIKNHRLLGNIFVKPSGDPTLGSWRWKQTEDSAVEAKMINAIKQLQITAYGNFVINDKGWDAEIVPDGWMWQDIGNYYGAGATAFNWRENQFDIFLKSGNTVGSPVTVERTKPGKVPLVITSAAVAAAKGTGDNAYVYYPLNTTGAIVRGTIPVGENAFEIAAANPNPAGWFSASFRNLLSSNLKLKQIPVLKPLPNTTILFTHYSPVLDSMVYWFLKKSINLYGEAFAKTLAFTATGAATTEGGVDVIRKFWKQQGIDPTELNIVDGSGLSPLNRVTTQAQVKVLQFARQQPWFGGFYNALPVYNNMKMKSGTINGVKGFCGYHTSKAGKTYIFSFLVNNYNGSASALVQKMYVVLNELK